MGMSESVCRIEKLENGYEVSICDPKIQAENDKPKSNWKDPWKGYAFTTSVEVVAFIAEHLDKLKPPPDADSEYSASFKRATAESD